MNRIRVALIQPFVAHYRVPFFNMLCRQQGEQPEYTICSGPDSYTSVKAAERCMADIAPEKGGLRWKFIKNHPLGKHFLWQSGLITLAWKKEFDVLIGPGNMYHLSTWVSLFLAKFRGKKTMLWTHGFLREEKNLQGLLRAQFYRLADGLLLYGNRSRELLQKRGFAPDTLQVVYNSLDYAAQCAVRENLSDTQLAVQKARCFKHSELPVLLFIGRLTRQKKLDLILQALERLNLKRTRLNLLLVGDGPERARLETRVQQQGLVDYVNFYGPCYMEEELGRLISMADVCVSPGEVGLTCMHTLVYGTPVITHGDADYQMPEFEAIEPGKTGSFFKRDDSDSLACSIETWFAEHLDTETVCRDCKQVIDSYYNPEYQVKVINNAVKSLLT